MSPPPTSQCLKDMDIIVGDIYSSITDPRKDAHALPIIRQVCRARPTGYQYMARYRQGQWDGYVSLMNSFKFPTGLLTPVIIALEKAGYHINVVKKPFPIIPSPVVPDMLSGLTLRDYQIEAINTLIAHGRGIAKMATNSGKTEVMAGVIKSLGFPKTLVLLHRKELLHQTIRRFYKRLGIQCGGIGDGLYRPGHITVAMIQTLSSHGLADFQDNVLLMIDECHHASGNQMLDVLNRVPGPFRFGFSGTPLKMDVLADMKLIGATGDVIYEVTNSQLIDKGFSATPLVNLIVIESDDGDVWDMRYQDAYSSQIIENKTRNKKIIDIARSCTGSMLILVSQIRHGIELRESIPGSVFVNGSDDTKFRGVVLDDMKDKSGIYIASPIFDEGIDVPGVDTVIIACGGKSRVKLLQRIGRGLRQKSGRNILEIYDFIDDTNKYLLKHSDARINTYVDEGFATKVIDS